MSTAPLCELREVTVRYGSFVANRAVSLQIGAGEIVALVGENGAGKSTLLHALYGLVPLASGQVRYQGQAVAPDPERAIRAGVGLVHQHFMLVPTLSVAENIVLGREPRRRGLFDRGRAEAEVEALAARYGLAIDARRPIDELTVGEAQRVEILKVLYRGARLLILDEPTAVLTPAEVGAFLSVLRRLVSEEDRGLLLVTHKLDEVMAVSDRIVVLRRGEVVASFQTKDCTQQEIARAMVGRELQPIQRQPAARAAAAADEGALQVRDLVVTRAGAPRASGVSFSLRKGEILGIAGVEGNGQAELCAALLGLLACDSGSIALLGRDITALSVRDRRRAGLSFVPEDRHRHGLILDFSLAENLLLGDDQAPFLIDRHRLLARTRALIADYEVRPADPEAPARSLSGGNQQKLVVGRELAAGASGPQVLIASQPTRGVDIGAIEAIHRRLLAARDRGAAILLVSAELDELQKLADRIAVMYRGRLVTILDNPPERPLLRERLGELMMGAAP